MTSESLVKIRLLLLKLKLFNNNIILNKISDAVNKNGI